jgi:putative peptide zinc metalloprotease protein
LERATIRAPASGFVTTPNAQLLTGVSLNAGDEFLQVDNTKVVEAEIEIPEAEIVFIKPGAKVRLRPWSERDQEIIGRVTQVAPSAFEEADNHIIRVKEPFRDAGALLRPAMTRRQPAPTAVDTTGNSGVIRVKASVPNSEIRLRIAVTGYAKISGPEMTVGQAYLRLCIRFLVVELWSWVP